jgi:hypothetical protein
MILTPGPPGEAHRHPNADEVVSKWPTPVSGEAIAGAALSTERTKTRKPNVEVNGSKQIPAIVVRSIGPKYEPSLNNTFDDTDVFRAWCKLRRCMFAGG